MQRRGGVRRHNRHFHLAAVHASGIAHDLALVHVLCILLITPTFLWCPFIVGAFV